MVSLPYHSGSPPGVVRYTTLEYDFQGRVAKTTRPNGTFQTVTYQGGDAGPELHVETFDSANDRRTFSVIRNGLLVETTDGYLTPDAVTTLYEYDGRGLLEKVYVQNALVADLDYDVAGNRTAISETNSGTTEFEFNALGLVTLRTDAKGQQTKYEYDSLDRLTARIEGYGTSGAIHNRWSYDIGQFGIGRLHSRSSRFQSDTDPYFVETLSYNLGGDITARDYELDVPGYPGNGSRQIAYGFSNGQLQDVTYPDAIGFERNYTGRGYPNQLRLAGGGFLEDVIAMNAFGQITETFYQNGVTRHEAYDSFGRISDISGTDDVGPGTPLVVQDLAYLWNDDGTLHQRSKGQTDEVFSYDSLARLTQAITSGGASRTKTFSYDDWGNLLSKTSSVPGDHDVSLSYLYPHRLEGSYNAAGPWAAATYSYDANGNITEYIPAGGHYQSPDRTIEYDAANRVTRVRDTYSDLQTEEFWYGPDGERLVRKSTWVEDSTTKVSWVEYLDGGRYERVYPEHLPNRLYVARVTPTPDILYRLIRPVSGSAWTNIKFLYRDHLGSIDTVADWNGVFRDLAYDPFGSRRASDWSSDATPVELETAQDDLDEYTQNGFTGHEHLDRMNLIHMKGRVYDPVLGRFLQPDPIVKYPFDGQSHNRYSYVGNRPLSAVDPSGFCQDELGSGPQLNMRCFTEGEWREFVQSSPAFSITNVNARIFGVIPDVVAGSMGVADGGDSKRVGDHYQTLTYHQYAYYPVLDEQGRHITKWIDVGPVIWNAEHPIEDLADALSFPNPFKARDLAMAVLFDTRTGRQKVLQVTLNDIVREVYRATYVDGQMRGRRLLEARNVGRLWQRASPMGGESYREVVETCFLYCSD